MNDYSDPKYKDLYKEILIDYHLTCGKFSPNPYPFNSLTNNERTTNVHSRDRNSKQKTNY